MELIGGVFRALHTIKGSGSMFGFEELAAFTHKLETAFQEVREGRLQLNSELIDLTLAALDQIRVDCRGRARRGRIGPCALRGDSDQSADADRDDGGRARSPEIAGATASPAAAGAQINEWSIRFAPGPEFMLCGANPILLLHRLRQLGELSVKASMAAVPSLADLDPERCYVVWEMVLSTAAERDAIRDVFIFVEDSCELTIEPVLAALP